MAHVLKLEILQPHKRISYPFLHRIIWNVSSNILNPQEAQE